MFSLESVERLRPVQMEQTVNAKAAGAELSQEKLGPPPWEPASQRLSLEEFLLVQVPQLSLP